MPERGKWFVMRLPADEDSNQPGQKVYVNVEECGFVGPDGTEFVPDSLPPGPITYANAIYTITNNLREKSTAYYRSQCMRPPSLPDDTFTDIVGTIDDPQTLSCDFAHELETH